MIKNALLRILLISYLFIFGCRSKKIIPAKNADSIGLKTILIDTTKYDKFQYEYEQSFREQKKKICQDLALYDVEDLKAGYELRLWKVNAMFDPDELYILKGKDSLATIFRYLYFHLGKKDGKIDSVIMNSLKPKTFTWKEYFQQLALDSLKFLKSQSAITNKSFGMLDGYINFAEISDSGKYKYLMYSAPEYFQKKDLNHKKFVAFKMRLTKPLNYQGMLNAPY